MTGPIVILIYRRYTCRTSRRLGLHCAHGGRVSDICADWGISDGHCVEMSQVITTYYHPEPLLSQMFYIARLKAASSTTGRSAVPWWSGGRTTGTPGAAKQGADTIRVSHPSSNSGVWTWLGQRRASGEPDPLSQPSSSPAENHYTHMDDSFNPELMGEALYAELDRESLQSGNPSYQNTNTAYSACGDVSGPRDSSPQPMV